MSHPAREPAGESVGPAPSRAAGSNAGFTLIELVVAMPIVLTGIAALALALSSVSSQQRQAETTAQVLSAAQGVLEDLRATNSAQIVAVYDGLATPLEGVVGLDGQPAAVVTAVDGSNPTLLQVVATVEWISESEVMNLTLSTAVFTGLQ